MLTRLSFTFHLAASEGQKLVIKSIYKVVAAALMLTAYSVLAADPKGFEVSYDLREAERKAIVYKNLNLTEQESEKFWPLYDKYRADTKEQAKKMMLLLERLSKNFNSMTAEEAESIVNEALGNELEAMEGKSKHFKKVESVLTGASLFRYFQIDQRADAVMKNNITRQIPLVPLDSMHSDKGE